MKLSIELVPASCWYSNVRSNVSPATWARLQRLTADGAGHRCEICGRQGVAHPLEAHEVWIYDDRRCTQRLDRLIALCPECHGVKHFGRGMEQHAQRRLLAWFAHVNGLSPSEALSAIRAAFDTHKRRSVRAWSLDLGVLHTRYGIQLDARGIELR